MRTDIEKSLLHFSDIRDTASPRSTEWGGLLSEQSADVPSSVTNSPGRDPEPTPSLSEAATAFVKKEVDGEAVVVAPAEGLTPLIDLGDDITFNEFDKYLHGDGTLQTSSATVNLDLKDMLVTPAGSKKATAQFNTEAEQVSSQAVSN